MTRTNREVYTIFVAFVGAQIPYLDLRDGFRLTLHVSLAGPLSPLVSSPRTRIHAHARACVRTLELRGPNSPWAREAGLHFRFAYVRGPISPWAREVGLHFQRPTGWLP